MGVKVCLDVDNVCCNTVDAVLSFINERIPNIKLSVEDLKSYWIEDSLPDEYKWIVPLAFERKEVWQNVKMIEGAAKNIQKLYNEGFEIFFATATTAENFVKKIKFLTRELPFMPPAYIKKHSISIKEKQLLNCDFLVDDCLENLTGDRSYISICFDYPWNQSGDEYTDWRFYRAKNWDEIFNLIYTIGGGGQE